MSSPDGVELTCSINTELPWKMVAKGSRSSTRRNNKKSVVRVAASDIEAEDKSCSVGTGAGESEPEKLGVSVRSQHFTERVEHVPIKKRRFIFDSLSPSSRSSALSEDSETRAQINHALPVSRLNPNLIDGRTLDVPNEKPDCRGHDFSGIEILADVACSSDMSNDMASTVDRLPAEDSVRQQDASTLSTHVDCNDSPAGTVDVSQKYTAVDSSDQAGKGKIDIVVPKKSVVENEQSEEHSRVISGGIQAKKISIALSDESSTERPKIKVEADDSENLAPEIGTVTVSGKSLADEPTTEKNNEFLKDDRLHWDLNVTMDAWGQPCDAEDEVSGRDVEGEVTESVVPKESGPINGNKDLMDGMIASHEYSDFPSPSRPKAETVVRNGKESQSGYDSQFEDGELREPYPWEENEGDTGEVEQVDYGSEPEDERLYSLVESNENKMEDSEKVVMAETRFGPVKCESSDAPRMVEANEGSDIEKHVVVCTNDMHLKVSSPSRSFSSKPYIDLPSHDTIPRRRPDNFEEYSEMEAGPNKFVGRDDRSGMRMRDKSPGRRPFNSWDSKRRFSPPPAYKAGSYGFGRSRPKSMVEGRGMMNGFDQSGSGPGPGPGPDGHVRRQFSNGGYRGRFRRFPDSGDRDFRAVDRPFPHGDASQFPGRVNNRMSSRRERGNSPVFRRLHYPQPYGKSESRSRSRSPVSWNGRNRSPPPAFRAEERMERVRLPFQKRFPAEQELGFMSPPRNRISPRFFEGRNNDTGENHSFRGRKSPGRIFRPGQRFDMGSSMRRVNSSDTPFRPFIRHRRFDYGGGGGGGRGGGSAMESGGRGCKYEGGDENSNGNRYEMGQRVRRSVAIEDGDEIRRFRFNGEQSLMGNSNNKES